MVIKEVGIENFKGIDSIKFKPKLLNVIVGRNNTGKTSIIEAIAMALDGTFLDENYSESPTSIINYLANSGEISLALSENRNTKLVLKFKRIDEHDLYKNIVSKTLNDIKKIQAGSEKKTTSGTIDSKKIKKAIDSNDISIFQDAIEVILKNRFTTDIIKKLLQDCVLVNNGNEEYLLFGNDFRSFVNQITEAVIEKIYDKSVVKQLVWSTNFSLIHYSTYSPIFPSQRKKSIYDSTKMIFVKNPLQTLQTLLITKEGHQELSLEIEDILKKDDVLPNLIRFDFTELVFDTPESRKSVKFNRMGEGFQTLVAILAILKSNGNVNSIFLMEEPEVHMHPGYVGELVKYLAQISSSLKIQFFITTHSYDLIQSLLEEENPDLKEFLEKNLLLLRLNKVNDTIIGENITYKDAKKDSSVLLLDLRGI